MVIHYLKLTQSGIKLQLLIEFITILPNVTREGKISLTEIVIFFTLKDALEIGFISDT